MPPDLLRHRSFNYTVISDDPWHLNMGAIRLEYILEWKGLRRCLFGQPLAVVASYQTQYILELEMKLNVTCILKPVIMSKVRNQLRVLSKQSQVRCATISNSKHVIDTVTVSNGSRVVFCFTAIGLKVIYTLINQSYFLKGIWRYLIFHFSLRSM